MSNELYDGAAYGVMDSIRASALPKLPPPPIRLALIGKQERVLRACKQIPSAFLEFQQTFFMSILAILGSHTSNLG